MFIPLFVEITAEPPFDVSDAMRAPSTVREPCHMESWKPEEKQGATEERRSYFGFKMKCFSLSLNKTPLYGRIATRVKGINCFL